MEILKIYSPHNNSVIKSINYHNSEDVDFYLDRALNLFKDRKNHLPKSQRIEILKNASSILQNRFDDLVEIAINEGGKPFKDTVIEIKRAIQSNDLAWQHLLEFGGNEIPMGLNEFSNNRIAYTKKEPIGVLAAVSAFNHPLNLIVHQTAPAFAVGCPVIIKPSLSTPLSCIEYVNILKQAGVPEGWCEYLIVNNHDAEKLVTSNIISYFSFIGSAKVGWMLKSKLAAGVKCSLEHGGTAPVVVCEDANIDKMIPKLIKGAFYHSGQVCVSVQRVFVPKSKSALIIDKLIEHTKKLIVGNPQNPETDCGPLISKNEVDRVENWISESIKNGAKCLIGGKKINDFYYPPTILLNPNPYDKVSKEEVFGPLLCLYEYEDLEEAINQANDVRWSFQAAVFTENLNLANYVSDELNGTAIMINDHTAFRVDWMPFGGLKESGYGIGGIKYFMNDLCYEKMKVVNFG